jgi:hypothetical protein
MTLDEKLELLGMLGLCSADFQRIHRLASAQAQEELKVLKGRARKALGQRARELHPDLNGGDEKKTELFTVLNRMVQEIEGLAIRPSHFRLGESTLDSEATTPLRVKTGS